jgi:threonine dehydratase
MTLPISFEEALAARERLRPYLQPTPLRSYEALDEEIGAGIRVLVKHENHQPTNAFKIRNALSVLTGLTEEQRRRGVVAATRGNHGQGVALAGRLLGVSVTVCVPVGNNPEKNLAMRGFGAELVEQGRDYDEAVEVARTLVRCHQVPPEYRSCPGGLRKTRLQKIARLSKSFAELEIRPKSKSYQHLAFRMVSNPPNPLTDPSRGGLT